MRLALALALGCLVSAQCSLALADSPLGETELKRKLGYYESVSELEVGFKQTKRFHDMDMEIQSEGRLKLKRPDQVTWEITRPSPVKVLLQGNQVRIETGKGKDLQVETYRASDAGSERASKGLASMAAWLTLDATALAREYEVKAESTETFVFLPKTPESSPFKSLRMTLESSRHLKTLVIDEKSGDRMTIQFGAPRVSRKK